MAKFNADVVIEILTTNTFHPVIVRQQAAQKISESFGCTMLTASKWIDLSMATGRIEFDLSNKDRWVVISEETKEFRKACEKARHDGVLVNIHSARVKRNREAIANA